MLLLNPAYAAWRLEGAVCVGFGWRTSIGLFVLAQGVVWLLLHRSPWLFTKHAPVANYLLPSTRSPRPQTSGGFGVGVVPATCLAVPTHLFIAILLAGGVGVVGGWVFMVGMVAAGFLVVGLVGTGLVVVV